MPNKQQILEKCRQYYRNVIKQGKVNASKLNIGLTSNPFLKDKQGFKLLKFQLLQYNKRVERGQVTDAYQILSYQKLHSMLSDLDQMQTRQDQVKALDEITEWFKEQSRLVKQRFDQGKIRYQMSKEYRESLKNIHVKEQIIEEKQLQIPFYIIQRIIEPYRRHSRTLHPQFEAPSKRLLEFKGKTINIPTFGDHKEQVKPPRVLYPRPPKYQEPKQQQPQQKPQEQQAPMPVQEGVLPEAQAEVKKAQEGEQGAPEQPGMDIGIGQQPQQPEQDETPQDVLDKLKPKNPIYVDPVGVDKDNYKKYKEGYMFYEGRQSEEQRNMELRYVRKHKDILCKQRQDIEQIQIANEWAKRKAKIAKDTQKKLQDFKFKTQFSFSKEPTPKQEKLSQNDQVKYGFTTVIRHKSKQNQVDLTLPELRNTTSHAFQEKSIRKQRLNSLRNKFAKVLNLSENQTRQSVPSLCQFTARRRGLSQIIHNHSQSKQRLNQIEEVGKIKEKLTKVKVNINIKMLSKGLCLPEDQHYFSETTREFPNKSLPSNPDMVQKKKKKKKK